MYKYSITYINENKNFYDFVYDELDKLGFKFVNIDNNPDLIFHINFGKKTKMDQFVINHFNNNKIIDSNIIIDLLSKSEKKNYIYSIFSKFKIPYLNQTNIGNIDLNEIKFPFVLKEKNSSQGKGIYFIENKTQLKKLERYYGNFFKNNFLYSKFIKTESNYYNHYRIFTFGNGKILGATLNYSKNTKFENGLEKRLYSDIIFDNPYSEFYLNRRKISSNISQGSNSIALNPNKNSKKINNLDKKILG